MSHVITVCCSGKCSAKGSDRILKSIGTGSQRDWDVRGTESCFGYCKLGPNVAVDGNILHGLDARGALDAVRSEIAHPSAKRNGIGTRTIDDLDDVLESL